VLDVLSRVRSRGEALNMLEKEHVEKDAQTVDEGHITDTVEVNAGEGKAAADEMPFAMPDKDEVVPFQRTVEAGNENLERVNEKFNEELQGLTADNADSKVLYLGTPSVELQSAGIESKPFKLYGSKLLKKTKKHGFEFTDIKDLPKAIAHPIAVFKGSERDSHAILTEIQIDGNNVLVAVNVGKNRDIDFNIISSTYGKSGKGVIGWINNGKLLYSDKEKTLNYLGSPALIAGAVNNSELDSATKIVEEFENPSIQEQKSSDSFKPIGRKAFDQLVNVLKKTGLARNVITDRAEMQEYLEKILGKDSADRFMMVWHGGLSQIEKFSYDHVARSGGRNKHGVGIYFGTTRVIGMAYAYSPEGGGFLHLARIDEAAHIPFTGEEVSEKDLRSVLENLPEVMRERVVEQMGKSPTYSSLYSSISNAYDEVEAVSGETMAERISKGLKIRNEKMDFASRVFARSGIDGYIQDRGAKGDFVVVFNDGVLSVEGVEEIREMRTRSGEVYGFVTPQGDVYIDPEKANANTPIHEFGHLWNDYIKDVNPDLYRRGSELIKSSPYWEKVNNNPAYARLSEEGKINEALAMAIGDKGELMMQSGDILGFSRLRAFINNLWEEIKKAMGFGRRLDIENMTLEEFAGNAVRELTRGKALSFSRSHENDTERRQSEIQYADASKYDFDVSGITEENAQEMQDIKDKGVENGTFMKAPNGKRSNLNERQWLQVRTEAFKKWFGEWESSAKYDIIFEGMPVSNLTGNEFAKDENGEPLVNRVTQFYKEKYDGQIERDNFGVVELGHREVQDSYYHGINRSKSIAFAAVPDIIQKGILISETENHKGRGYDTYTFAAPVNIGSDRHIGFVTVTRKGETNRFYLHGVVLQKNLRNGFETGQAGSPLGDIAKILQNFYEANKNSSRVVDENGEPLVVYHGTSNEFTVFGERKGDSQGTYLKNRNGFFFANRKEAELYGNGILMPAFINLRNPNMVDVQHNLSELEYDYKTERDEAEEAGYPIARWLGEGEAEFEANDSATAYLDDNMDEIIEDTENNDNDGVFVIGADGSRTVISFAPSQIKSAANNNGNFDNNSDDIRFQFIGEKGAAALDKAEEATMRLDNLAVAREMEKTFGDKQTKEQRQKIKLATGWERGADGKWRYEMPDIEINDNIREIGKGDISALPLDDVISGKELFKAYPQLKGIMVDIDDDMPASASFDGNTISLQELTILGSYNNLKKSIIHELQHAIQDIEGFAQGGRWTKETVSERIKAGYEIAEFIEDKAKESNIPIRKVGEKIRQMDLFYGLYKEVFDHLINNPYFEENIKDLAKQAKEPTGYERYRRLAGETEARNAEHRMNMPAAERRASLVEETEDVAREDQIIIYKSLDKSHSGKDFKGETERIKSEIARAEQETDTNPTEGQKKAGNYRKGHVRIQGFDISIEQPKGSVRRGVDENGKAWESKMYNTYGYFGKTESRDGDHIDVFLGENPLSKKVFVVDQVNPETGKFDEHKVMFGFDGIDEARKAYMSNYEKGWKGLGSITETDVETFRSWANKDGARVKAFSQYRDISANVEEKKKRIEKLRNSKPVEISGEEYKGKYELNPKSAKEYIKNNLRGTYTNKDTGETIDVSRVGMDKVTSHGEKDEAHLKSIAAIPQLIEDSIFIDELQNEKGNDKYDSYRYYVSGLKIGSEDYTAKIVVGVKEGKKYYDHELTSIEKGKLIDDLNLIAKQVANQSVSYSGIKDTKLLSILQNESPQGKESPDDNIRFQVRTAGTAAESEEKKKLLEAARADLNKRLSGGARLREIYQDRYIPVKHFIDTLKEFGTVVEDYDNWYLSATHLDGKVDAQLDAYNKKFQRPLNEAVNDFLKEGATKREVENYAMLKHGLERNKRMREEALKEFMNENPNATQAEIAEYELRLPKDYSGVTAIEAETGKTAKNNISEFEAKYGQKLIDRFWKRVNEATDFSLGTLYKGGLMDKDTYENIKNRDRYYVPLRGHDATTAEDMYNYYQDMGQYFSDPVKTAKGRRSRAELPLEYIYQMAHSSILSAVRNTQNQKMLRLAWKDRTGLIRANETWYINGIAQVPEYDADPDVYAENVRKFDEDMVYAEKNGLAGRAKSRLNIGGMFIKYPQAQQHTIQVTQNGKDYTVYINANPSVAQAVTGLNTYRKEYNPESEKLKNKKGEETTFSKVIHATLGNYPEMLRFIAANLTSRNPMFVLSNAIRDYGYTAFSSSVKEGVKYSARLQGNIPDAIGALTRFAAGKGNLNKKQDRYLVDYIMQGGKTGFSHLVNIDRIQKEVERDIKNGNHKNVIRTILDFMQHTNDVAENACRLATFITSREAGRSMEQSIADAKDITVNFNRKGAGGTGKILGPIANFLRWHYMFTNVAIQALQNAGKMIRENPKRATGAIMVSSGMFALPYLMTAALGGEDEYFRLSEYDRKNNMCFYVPGGGFVKIPVAQELRVLNGLVQDVILNFAGKKGVEETALGVATSLSDLLPLNPLGSAIESFEDPRNLGAFTPDRWKPLVETFLTNRDFTGASITKDFPGIEKKPGYMQAKVNKKGEPYAPEWLMFTTEWLNTATGGNNRERGVISLNPDKVNHLANGYMGALFQIPSQLMDMVIKGFDPDEDVKIRDTQLKRFFSSTDELPALDRYDERDYRKIEAALKEAKSEKDYLDKAVNNHLIGIDEYAKGYEKLGDMVMFINHIMPLIKAKNGEEPGIKDLEDDLKYMSKDEQRAAEAVIAEKKKKVVEVFNKLREKE
jgi:hypothetical protein